MASQKLKCRVCGKEYDACRSSKRNDNVFHWQEVACSPECGSEYLRRVLESRGQTTVTTTQKRTRRKNTKTEQPSVSLPDHESSSDMENE